MLRNIPTILLCLGLSQTIGAQESRQPQVKLNVLNVCAPSPEEQQQIASALDRIPRQPSFSVDFEIDRGRSLLDQGADLLQPGQVAQAASDAGTADWVRIRRDFASQSLFSNVQYSFSRDAKSMMETLVFRVRDPKEFMQLAIEDSASAVTSPANMLATDTPVSRINLERFGKSSIALARCYGSEDRPAPDQSAYEPLFRSASAVAAKYRSVLGVRRTVPGELARLSGVVVNPKQPTGSASKKRVPGSNSK